MAKIVPQAQYADIGAYNELDDYRDVMEILSAFSGEVSKAKESHKNDISGVQRTIFDILNQGQVTSPEMLESLTNQYKVLSGDINKLDSPELSFTQSAIGGLLENEQSGFKIFDEGFDKAYNMDQDSSKILSRNATPDVWNKDVIENLSVNEIRSMVTDFSNMSASVGFDRSTGKINTKYKTANKYNWTTQHVENYLQFASGRLQNIKDAKLNVFSDEEWEYIMTDPSNVDFDKIRDRTLTIAMKDIEDRTRMDRAYGKVLNDLKFNKINTLGEIIDNGMKDSDTKDVWGEESDELASNMGGNLFAQFIGLTPDAITEGAAAVRGKKEHNLRLQQKRENNLDISGKEELPISPYEERLLTFSDLYDDMIDSITTKSSNNITVKGESLKKYNDWSEVSFGSEFNIPETIPTKTRKEKIQFDFPREESTEEGTFDAEGNLIESGEPKDKIVSAFPEINVEKDIVNVPLGRGKITQLGNKTNEIKKEVDNFVITKENQLSTHKIKRGGYSALKDLLPEGQDLTGNNLLILEKQFNADNDEFKNTVAEIEKILNVFEEVEVWGGQIGGKNKVRDTLKRYAQRGLLPSKIDKNSDYGQKLLPLLEKLKTIRRKWGDEGLLELIQSDRLSSGFAMAPFSPREGASSFLKIALEAYNTKKGSWKDMRDKYQATLDKVKKIQ